MHEVKRPSSALIWFTFLLNFCFSIVEMIGGAIIGSQSIIANGLHDFSDALFVGVSWFLEKKSDRQGDELYTYGYRRFSLLASLLSGVLLIGGSLLIIASSAERFYRGEFAEPTNTIFIFIGLGILINGGSYFLTHRRHSHHEKMLSLHFLEDLAGWVFILIGTIVSRLTGIHQIDLALSVALAFWIIWRGGVQLHRVTQVLLQMSPGKRESIRARLQSFEAIKTIHHLHLWSLDGEHHILTSHLALHSSFNAEQMAQFKMKLRKTLRQEFSVTDSTFEFELPGEICHDETCGDE